MNKREEKAMQYCCTKCKNNKLNCGMKPISHGRNCIACSNYIEGYNQAEKDLELTWEDVKEICDIAFEEACRLQRNMKGSLIYKEQHYQEVLNRFNKQKGE